MGGHRWRQQRRSDNTAEADGPDVVEALYLEWYTVRDTEGENKAVLLASHLDRVVFFFAPHKREGRHRLVKAEVHAKSPDVPVKVFSAEECRAVHWKFDRRVGEAWPAERRAKLSANMTRI
jgi:hypothetical protein